MTLMAYSMYDRCISVLRSIGSVRSVSTGAAQSSVSFVLFWLRTGRFTFAGEPFPCEGEASGIGRESWGAQMSRKRTSRALRWMKERRDSTSSPIRIEKISSAAAASSRVTCSSTRESGFIVVSHSSW